ncbi:hATC-domain-containing protein, partial [Laetiporus sulphureus 93-53]
IRDEVRLIQAISVKEHSSSQHKERFHDIQVSTGVEIKDVKTLLIDMKVRWSSTYMMLNQAYGLHSQVNKFVTEILRAAKDMRTSTKLYALLPRDDEWKHVKSFQRVLQIADFWQQHFSSENDLALHLALPALKDLHAQWTAKLEDPAYAHFTNGLQAGLAKIAEYYDKTGDNDAYVFSIMLDLTMHFGFFKEGWSIALQKDAMELMKKINRYVELNSSAESVMVAVSKMKTLQRYLSSLVDLSSDDDDEARSSLSLTQALLDPEKQWEHDFQKYIDLNEDVPDGMSTVQWWGLNAHCFPVWASLTKDYLAIMATSVSSERAFSSAGITITKHRNCLKGDIVEALQILKCAYKKNLLYRDLGPSSSSEEELNSYREGEGSENPAICEAELDIELDTDSEELDNNFTDSSAWLNDDDM